MIKWTITYTDYNDNKVTDEVYFNLSKVELMNMQFMSNGTYGNFVERITEERDIAALGAEFQRIILDSYGVKSDDGKTFMKSEELRNKFKNSEAYSELFMELVTDADKATKFIQGILPKDLQASAANALPTPEVV